MVVMSETTLISQPAPGRYLIDPERSRVTILTRHLFGLAPVRGTLALRAGAIIVTEPADGSTVRACAAASTFASGNPARDAAVLSARLLDATASPSISFTSTGLARAAGQWLLRGELTVRGVSRPVEARVTGLTLDEAGPGFRARARFSVDRYSFGLTAYRGLAARWLTVDLDLRAEEAGRS
jgi:polyisoprenoid-binding protein YceI